MVTNAVKAQAIPNSKNHKLCIALPLVYRNTQTNKDMIAMNTVIILKSRIFSPVPSIVAIRQGFATIVIIL